MDCQQAAELLPWWMNGSLEAEERRQVDDHLAACASCHHELDETADAWQMMSWHIPSLALAEFAEGLEPSGLDRDLVARHLEECASCRAEAELATPGRVIDFTSAARAIRMRLQAADRRPLKRVLAVAASLTLAVLAGAVIWSLTGVAEDPQAVIETAAANEVPELPLDAWQEQPARHEPIIVVNGSETILVAATDVFADGFESGSIVSWPKARRLTAGEAHFEPETN